MNIMRIKEKMRNWSMKTKLMVSFSALVLLTTSIILIVLYRYVYEDYKKQILFSADQSFSQAHGIVEKKISNMIYTSEILYFNSEVQEILSQSTEYMDYGEQYRDMLRLEKELRHMSSSEDIFMVSLYLGEERVYANQRLYFYNRKDLEEIPYFTEWEEERDHIFWIPPREEIVADHNRKVRLFGMLRKIRAIGSDNRIIGLERVSARAEELDDIIKKADITKTGIVFIRNSHGEIISTSKGEVEQVLKELNISREMTEKNNNWNHIETENAEFLLHSRQISDTDWMMCAVISYNEFMELSSQTGEALVTLMLIITIITCSVAYFIAHSITRRLSLLAKQMENVKKGKLDTMIYPLEQDEVGKLITSFQFMLERIQKLAAEQYENGKAIKNAELKALQAQINPHFLYNILDLINWMALDNEVPQISSVALAMAKFYKLSLNKGKDRVSFSDELEHVSIYMRIQNYRFEGMLNLEIDVQNELKEGRIIKNILQPIVENSILHGLLPCKDDRKKVVIISAKRSEETLYVYIKDNGVGMSEEIKSSLLKDVIQHSEGGYGVWNIDQRLKLSFGEDYGLEYQSEIGKGTEVILRMPFLI